MDGLAPASVRDKRLPDASAAGRAHAPTARARGAGGQADAEPLYRQDHQDRQAAAARITAEANRGWHINLAEHQADTLSVAAPLVLWLALALVVGARWTARRPSDRIGQALLAASRQLTRQIDG